MRLRSLVRTAVLCTALFGGCTAGISGGVCQAPGDCPESERCGADGFCVPLVGDPGSNVVINEVYYNSPGTDTGTFCELKGPPGLSLDGYALAIYNKNGALTGTIFLSGSIPASGYFVVAQDTSVPFYNQIHSATDLVNTGGSLILEHDGLTLDALSYGNPAVVLGEGQSAPSAGGSVAEGLSRIPNGQDTQNNAQDFVRHALTPGASNDGTEEPIVKKVLFDRTKSEDAGDADWRIDGAYSEWADALREKGYEVDSLFGDDILAEDLVGVHVLVIPEPQDPFSDSERQVIIDFVAAGGGLLLLGDHRISDRNNNGWDSPEVFNGWDGSSPSNVPQHLRRSLDTDTVFGIGFSFNSGYWSPVYTVFPATSHPVLEGVNSAGVYVGTHLNVYEGVSLLERSGKTYLAANTLGEGRVLAFGDSSAFSDGSYSNGSTNHHNDWVKLDNARLALNMIDWLAKN